MTHPRKPLLRIPFKALSPEEQQARLLKRLYDEKRRQVETS
jgi:hypothetical protein